MLACAFALTLLAIVAGMMLLAQTKRENLGNMYKYVSWFIIVCGFLSILAIGAKCAMKCCPMMREHRMMMREGRMMDCRMGHMGGCGMMSGHRGMMGGCGMMNNGCCEGMNEGCCNQGMMDCHEGMDQCQDGSLSGCHEGMGECKDGKDCGTCPMMKEGAKDSVKKK